MPTPSPKLGLALPSQPDDFSTADVRANWEKIDAAPGLYICTSTTRPSWGVNQAGRQIYETNTGVTRAWTGTTWAVSGYEPGDIKVSARTEPGEGWLACDGTTRNRSTFSHLFAAIGTSYNTGGEAATDFRLPSLIGRTILGRDPANGTTYNIIGERLGSPTSAIGTANLPPHTHTINHGHTASSVAADTNHRHYWSSGYSGGHGHTYTRGNPERKGTDSANLTAQTYTQNGTGIATGGDGGHSHENWTSYQSEHADPRHSHSHTISVVDHTGSSGNGPGASAGLSVMQPTLTLSVFIKI